MEPWSWIAAYLVGFTLVQLLLVRYVADDRSAGRLSLRSGDTSAPRSADTGHTGEARQSPPGRREADGVRCPHCGTRNAAERYTYCRECIGQLG